MVCRRFDRTHLLLLGICTVLTLFIIQNQISPGKKYEAYEIPSYKVDTEQDLPGKPLTSYDRATPLLWIGGVPRSGTTLMRAMLDAHPSIRCGEETRVIPRILGQHTKMFNEKTEMSRLAEAHITKPLLLSAMAAYILTVIEGHGEKAPLLCNKDPFAIRSLPNLVTMFPNSKFILMIRDGRSVTHSIISRHITIKGFDIKTYDGALKNWNTALTSMLKVCNEAGPEKCLPVYYERLVIEPEAQMRRILQFTRVPWNDKVLHHEQMIGKEISLSRREPSTNQVNKAVNLDALNKWEQALPPPVRQQLDNLAPLLRRLGYRTDTTPMDYTKHLNPIAERSLEPVLS